MTRKKITISLALLAFSLYILTPTPDELIVYPVLGIMISNLFGISVVNGQVISAFLYRFIGVVALGLSIFVGGKPIYDKLRKKFS